jgi:hypothetical protein
VVVVDMVAKFIDTDGLAGRFNVASRLPQYLMNAIFGCADAVALDI